MGWWQFSNRIHGHRYRGKPIPARLVKTTTVHTQTMQTVQQFKTFKSRESGLFLCSPTTETTIDDWGTSWTPCESVMVLCKIQLLL